MNEKQKRIAEIEAQMSEANFWDDKARSQTILKEHARLKAEVVIGEKFEKGDAIINIFSGAGGDDAEDFSRMLLEMYMKYATRKNWSVRFLHENKNDHGGYRNVTFEISPHPLPSPKERVAVSSPLGRSGGVGPYGTLKNESGVHRLVRISPFNADKKRHTSFSLVEVLPRFEKTIDMPIPPEEIRIEFAKAGGPGGQNVNKRETAVRLIHIPTKISVHVSSERSQAQNREKAMEILQAKLYKMRQDEQLAKEKGMQISKTTDIEWGNQIRSYVLHPYKMVKDHRTDVETAATDKVLAGDIDIFIEAEKNI